MNEVNDSVKYALEDLRTPQGALLLYPKGSVLKNLSDEDVEKYGWADLIGDEPPKEDSAPQPDRAEGAGFVAENPATPGAAKRAQDKVNGAAATKEN